MIEIVFFVLFIGPFLVKYFHFFYFLQLHNYSLTGIREEFWEKIFKKVFFNFWSVIEIPFFLIGIILFFLNTHAFEFIFTDLIFYYLMILNVYVLWKLFRGRILKPRFDRKTLSWIVFFWSCILAWYWFSARISLSALYVFILFFLIFPYFLIDIFYKIFGIIEKIFLKK